MKFDYNSVMNTLTYLDVSSANAKLRRIEDQLNRPVRDPAADREAAELMANFKLEESFDKLLVRDAKIEKDGSAREYFQTEILALELVNHEPEDFDRPSYAAKVDQLRYATFKRRKELAEKFGNEGRRRIEDLIQLPSLIERTKKAYVFEEARRAHKGSWILNGAAIPMYMLGALLVGAAAWLPTYWDGPFLDVMNGDESYRLAPILFASGLGVVGAVAVIRLLVFLRIKTKIGRAKRGVNYEGNVPVSLSKAAKYRADRNARPTTQHTLDRHKFDDSSQDGLKTGLKKLEKMLMDARHWLEKN
ncbi:MAG: hypothetical protein JKY71_07730 [Alphaproteobacteria bacterium]|jgi:hypothetical protein|uniref:hypothetical protein n=1 Tax=uncultured Henriciella sp. TaxID=1608424 RepID=UPI000C36D772|nr:hypothetical protein [Henriciella sp.]MBF35569.1 hypothetical protein [Hyphomonadaceae bacterium]MBL4804739.1 hypothetical protein [Alphaproteobacteria bacterium]|tara:strand:+ start:2386 stop:3297 length:912 start_codon:yes stop_codon:yes gene_type:complete